MYNENLKIVLPNAPLRPITVNNGLESSSWYDVKTPPYINFPEFEGQMPEYGYNLTKKTYPDALKYQQDSVNQDDLAKSSDL